MLELLVAAPRANARRATESAAACPAVCRDGRPRSRAGRAARPPPVVRRQAPVHAISFAFTYSTPLSGSNADSAPLRAAVESGKDHRPRSDASGMNGPSLRKVRNCLACSLVGLRRASGQHVLASGRCRANGAGLAGTAACAARLSLPPARGDRRYSIGNSGAPFARSNRKTWPCFVVCATASTACRPRDGHQRRRRGEVAVPDVVAHRLEMPEPLAGAASSASSVFAKRLSPCGSRRRSRRRRIPWARRRSRAARRPPCPASCWRRRCTSMRPSATSRSRARPDAGWCGRSSASAPVRTS